MRRADLRRPLRIGLLWLVWLALLVPAAQSAATWHAFSHASAETSAPGDDPSSPALSNCDLCLTAAAIGAGGLLAAPSQPPPSAARHALEPAALVGVWPSRPALAYLSRAPPTVPR
ncbi:MAG: hypothetical protein HY021_07970 [Burkholderiales bacterium]|nr:hypothetical protein [Burkholderiales bacterium]